ncbi:hypothetical protein [Halopiger xanaduensis]|uniref:Ig-like domain-containing protein n=1 Tax=Halopiger xanaduensis (strain DSM 18323 / JCM 14033 / SH-6) TaxID=797210 RepID=F8DAD4_HALXS|nr:hypothetical protein [Halopiger xanaduensis]AEH37963.1 hypothetical protein Halxa_3351 [Halopiger xanaduensis SH-6]
MTIDRRTFLGGLSVAVVGTAGCLSVNSDGATDITVSNERSQTATATLRVTRLSDGARLLEDTLSLDEDESEAYDEVVSGARVEVQISVDDGPPETYEWSDGESDASGLFVDIEADSITFSPVIE